MSHPSQASNTLLTGNYQGISRNLREELAIQFQNAWILQGLGEIFPDVNNRELEIQNREGKQPFQRICRGARSTILVKHAQIRCQRERPTGSVIWDQLRQ